MGRGQVVIDCFPEHLERYGPQWAVVAVDVIRATTSALTALAQGRRCLPVASLADAFETSRRLPGALLVGELHGEVPGGFDLDNSPASIAERDDIDRPLILLSTSGTRLLTGARSATTVYAACLRNHLAQVAYVAGRHERVVVIGAGSRGEFRDEDALCCAWIAEGLVRAGYEVCDDATARLIEGWHGAPLDAIRDGRSADFLRRAGKEEDLEYVLGHVNDLTAVAHLRAGELVYVSRTP